MVKKSDEIQNYIAQVMEQRSRQSCFDYNACQAILERAAEINSDAISGIGYYYFAEYYWNEDNYEKTMYCLGECAKCFQAAGMYEFLARSYNMMGAVSDTQDNMVVALNYYYTGLQYARKHQLHYVHAMINSNIGNILMRMKRYAEAAVRYEQSVQCYEKSEGSFHLGSNLLQCMICCGSCYLRLQQPERAFALWDKIEKLQQEVSDRNDIGLSLRIYEAECEAAKGRKGIFLERMDEILQQLREMQDVSAAGGALRDIAELLLDFREYERLDEFFRIVDAGGADKQPMLEMDLYACRSVVLLQQNRTEEYIRHTRKYFTIYEKDRQNNRQLTARVMELRDKLSSMERNQERIRAYNRRLENMALYDSMTNLANRTYLNEYTSGKFEEAQQQKKLLGVELLDIDYFKNYNDTYGHLSGDACIEAVGGVLRGIRSDKVFCGRYGGDEFMIVYNDMSPEEIRRVAEEIQQRIRGLAIPHKSSECADIVTVSQGIFVHEPEEENREWDFNAQADNMLYHAKRDGRNCYRIQTVSSE